MDLHPPKFGHSKTYSYTQDYHGFSYSICQEMASKALVRLCAFFDASFLQALIRYSLFLKIPADVYGTSKTNMVISNALTIQI